MNRAVILSAVRTPVGRYGGGLAGVRPDDLAAIAVREAVARAGVPAEESHEVLETIERLPGEMAIVFIEHDMSLVFRFARRITVMVSGQILTEGSPLDIASDERVRELYLGEDRHHA